MRLARQEPPRPAGLPKVLLLGASTGGPPALQRLLCSLPGDLSLCVVLAQHMPARFTRAFAERLDKISAFEVREARDGDALAAGRALVAPGGRQLRLVGSFVIVPPSFARAPCGNGAQLCSRCRPPRSKASAGSGASSGWCATRAGAAAA